MIELVVDILLVEDSPADVELTLRAFERANLTNTVHVVRDGEEALDYLFRRGRYASREDRQPRVILLDLKLPKVDGLEVLRQVRAHEETRLIPVVVLTSSREEQDVVESYALGSNGYVVKPVEFGAFAEAVAVLGMYWLLLNESPPLRR